MKKLTFMLLFSLAISNAYAQLGNQLLASDNLFSHLQNGFTQIVDLNNDGRNDIVTIKYLDNNGFNSAWDTIFWFQNNNGSFSQRNFLLNISTAGENIHQMKWEDVNGDGYPDLFLYVWENVFQRRAYWRYYRNLQNGTLASPITISTISTIDIGYPIVRFTDYDGDGDIDFSVGNSGSLQVFAHVYRNNNLGSSWTFTSLSTTANSTGSGPALRYNMDQDTIPDIIMFQDWPIQNVVYLQGLTGLSHSNTAVNTNLGRTANFDVVDIDFDGDLDIIGGNVSLCTNNGSASFTATTLSSGTYLTYADVDGDSLKDVITQVLSGSTTNIYYHRGQLNGVSSTRTTLGSFTGKLIGFDDHNGDGKVDFYYRNNGSVYVARSFVNVNYRLAGTLFYDANQNKQKDATEQGMPFQGVKILPDGGKILAANGNYRFNTDPGYNVVLPEPLPNWSLTTDSISYTSYLTSSNPIRFNLNFGFYPTTPIPSIQSSFNAGIHRCGRNSSMWVNVKNTGTTLASGNIQVTLDDSVQFSSASILPDSISNNQLFWNYDSLFFFEEKKWQIWVQMPSFANIGDTIISSLIVNQIDSGNVVSVQHDTINEILRCSYDPNDKAVSPRGRDTVGFISANQDLTYLIRFQNTGNDTAFDISINDRLDTNLDFSTFQPIASSHSMSAEINDQGHVWFDFFDINLLDSNANEPESHGFVKFKVSQRQNLPSNTVIKNKVNIYFDFNPPITTNTVINTIECYGLIKPIISQPNRFTLRASNLGIGSIQWYRNNNLLAGQTADTLQTFQSGSYTIELTDSNNCSIKSDAFLFLSTVGLNELESEDVLVFPNPFSNQLIIRLSDAPDEELNVRIFNSQGQLVRNETYAPAAEFTIERAALSTGLYWLEIQLTTKKTILKEMIVVE